MLHREIDGPTIFLFALFFVCLILFHVGLLLGVKAKGLDERPVVYEVSVDKAKVRVEHNTYTSKKEQVKEILKEHSLPIGEAFSIINCESRWKPHALNVNQDGSVDRGLWQINSKYHPDVSNREAFDVVSSTLAAVEIYKERGNWSAWRCGRFN